ncbi:hypothetical protein ACSFC1_08715 [Pseudothermotoga sp. U03pept]|uniref:hypothetical protein n=1 Tax=Pseudothermotoga sp. U03pept TaxID=3447012 RepID=UPI003F0A0F35
MKVYDLSLNQLYRIADLLQIQVDFDVLLVETESIYEFHTLTGKPYHVGGIYVDGVIMTQPFDVLEKKGVLEQTIVHEMLHYLIQKSFTMPRWFEEGLILYLTGTRVEELKGEHRDYLERFMREVSYEDIPNLVSCYRNGNFINADLGP